MLSIIVFHQKKTAEFTFEKTSKTSAKPTIEIVKKLVEK
jgi:hypothetical protein